MRKNENDVIFGYSDGAVDILEYSISYAYDE